MKLLYLLACTAQAGCAATTARGIDTQEVAVTHTERAVTEKQVLDNPAPTPLGPRPADARPAADLLAAKVCEYVHFAATADLLAQHAAGMTPRPRIFEPMCAGPPPDD